MKYVKLLLFVFVILFTTSAFSQVPTAGLVAYYPFNGNANDASGNGNNGTVHGATLTADRFGNPNRAYNFAGNAYISYPELFPTTVAAYTFSVWVSLSAFSNAQIAILYKGAVQGESQVNVTNAKRASFSVKLSDANWYTCQSTGTLNNATNYHVAGRYNKGGRIDIWLNGVKQDSVVVPNLNLFVAAGYASTIGAYDGNGVYSQYWNGVIDDIRFYNRALSDAEIVSLFNEVVPVEMTTYSAKVNGQTVTLNWTTQTELQNSGWDIERSNGNSQWTKIGFKQGNGSSTTPHQYSFIDKSSKQSGNYAYRLKQIDYNGTSTYSREVEAIINVPLTYSLNQNYPNPFNPSTAISYRLSADSKVSMKVYNVLGKDVATLVNEEQKTGEYSVNFSANNLPNGVYFYQLCAGSFTQTKKMILLK